MNFVGLEWPRQEDGEEQSACQPSFQNRSRKASYDQASQLPTIFELFASATFI